MENKKLVRSATDRKLCGVCGGLAEYFNVDSTVVRIIMLCLMFFAGMSLWVYFIAALLMPEPEAVNNETKDENI